MRLVTFEVDTPLGSVERVGALADRRVVDLASAYGASLMTAGASEDAASAIASATIGPTMIDFFQAGAVSLRAASEAIQFALAANGDSPRVGARGARLLHDLDSVRLKAPVPRPTTLRDYTGFQRHMETFFEQTDKSAAAREMGRKRPQSYKGNPSMVIGPNEVIPWPSVTTQLDVEIEVAAFVARSAIDISPDEAPDYIAGYTIFNDITMRDVQAVEMDMPMNVYGFSKSKDAGGYPMGPCIATPDELDIGELELVLRVNGTEWCRGNTRDMTWTFADMLAEASRHEPIHPGDCLAGGSPPYGTGREVDRWITPGDVVECEVEGIGVLRNVVGEPAA